MTRPGWSSSPVNEESQAPFRFHRNRTLGRYVGTPHRLRSVLQFPGRIGDMDRRERRPLDITSVALLGAKLAFCESDLAARQRDNGRTQAGKAFEHIVI